MRWLFRRRSTPDTPQPLLDAAAIVRRARRLRFRVRPGSLAALAGAYHGARPGTGLTFAELRPYEPGDDVRHLDWNVTARLDRPYVRRYVEERSLTVWLIVDVSASMRFGAAGRTKADRAAQAAALIAAAAVQNGDQVGLVRAGEPVRAELPPRGGARQLARLLRFLVTASASPQRADLAASLRLPRRRVRRGLIVVLSDFLDPQPVPPWRDMASRHQVLALRLIDPREERLPPAGLLTLHADEEGRSRVVDSSSAAVRRAYRKAAEERRRAFRAWCGRTRVQGHDLDTEIDPLGPLLRIFRSRTRPRGGQP